MKTFSFEEFKPTIFFLIKFLGFYLVMNMCYGLYVTSYDPSTDPVTRWSTEQTAQMLLVTNHQIEVRDHDKKATTALRYKNRSIVSVYEGCNGVNIIIIFLGFLFAFGPYSKKLIWFIPAGILMIHFFNLVRIGGLFLITLYKPTWLYFTHKYLFTAFIYAIVFFLWLWWVRMASKNKASHAG
jgi:exosortase family protein XrtF